MNSARENILRRVRAALQQPAPRPPAPTASPVFPPVGDPVDRFCREFVALRGEIVTDLKSFLAGFTRIAIDTSTIVQETCSAGTARLAEAELGVTCCDCLVAQTGSVVVSTHSTGGRAVSVLPPVHLVIARRDQVLPDLATAVAFLRRRYDGHWPSSLSVITGPSRTADIEKILVMGAHGPKRLAICFVG